MEQVTNLLFRLLRAGACGIGKMGGVKRAKQKKPPSLVVKTPPPRNPLATDPLLAKGGAHARRDKRAARARQKAGLRRTLAEQAE